MLEENQQPLPFHEALVRLFSDDYLAFKQLCAVIRLIKMVKIPKGHDEIIEALRSICARRGWADAEEVQRLEVYLLEQKAIAEAKAADSEKMKKEMLVKALERAGGNRTRTAAILGITYRSLHERMQEHGLE